jgi:hypothetical protein
MISADTVTETWQRMARTPPSQASQLVDQMRKEQPAILAFLLATDEDLLDQSERESVFYIGVVVWQIMKQSPGRLRRVPIEQLEKIRDANYEYLEDLAERGEDLTAAAQAVVETCPEPEVIRYVMEAIMEVDESGATGFREESYGAAFIHLKIVLDALCANLR